MAPRKVHPIGKRFTQLRAKLVLEEPTATISTTRSQVKIYFIVADVNHKLMCRYYWEEGDLGGVWNNMLQIQVLEANADPSAPTGVTGGTIGVEGGGVVAKEFPDPYYAVDIDGFAAEGRTSAYAGIAAAGKEFFTVYFHDIDVDGRSPSFKLQFRGNPPKDLVNRDLHGHLFRLGPKKQFSRDDSWIPRF
ncbi:MAG: hypothetical protein ACJ8DQ_01615 [Xanthobacteraceae bacterium]|jgi:hypothetical protein